MAELNLILLGPPGSGKGTQGERLQEDLEYPYYATGDILRAAVKDGTEVGNAAKEYIDRGELDPDEDVYHVEYNPPEKDGVCDVDGSELFIRDYDKPEVVRHRLEQYHEKTAPLVDYYRKQGLLNTIDGADNPDRVGEKIRTLVSTLRLEEGN